MRNAMRRTALQLHEKITGRKVLARLEELNRTQWLSRDELLALQREKLQRLVEYAYQYVPYYHRIFDQAGFHPCDLRKDINYLNKLPILTKATVRENFKDLITTEPERRKRMSPLYTSGSTGEPLSFMQDSNFRDYVTADVQRHMGWAGWVLGDPQAVIWGARLDRKFKQKIRAQMIDWVWNRVQLNAFLMTEETMSAFSKQIRKRKPRILFGYATCLHQFAQFIQHSAYTDIKFDGIFSTAEVLLPPVRQYLEDTFSCKVFNRYGTLELGGIACECNAHTGLHVSEENNYIEILEGESPVGIGELGSIIVTNLNNLGMPFIRYSIGDEGTWYAGNQCPCGRSSIMLENIEGRLTDMFRTQDGHLVRAAFSGGFQCLNHPTIIKFQAIQKSLDRILMRLVPNGEIPQSTLDEIVRSIRTTFGENVFVEFEFLDEIQPLPSGKHQYAVSELPFTRFR